MFNPFKPAFGNMLQSVMTAPPNGGVAPAFRNPFAGGGAPNQTQSAPNDAPMPPSNPAAPSSAPASEQTTPEQPQSVAAQAHSARAGLSEIGAPVPQPSPDPQQTPGASLPAPVEAPPKPVPMPTEILQNAMMDPALMRQAEDLRSVTKLAFWEAVGQGNVKSFLETETGKMLNFSLEQFGDTLRNFAVSKGWMDPELDEVNNLSDQMKTVRVMKAEDDLRMNRITKDQYDDIMLNVVPYLDSKTPRQRTFLRSMTTAFAPVYEKLVSPANYGSQIMAQVDANKMLNEREKASLDFQKLSEERKYGLQVKQYDLARQQLLQQQDQFSKELGFKKWSTTLANDLALDKAKMDKLQSYTNAYQTFGYSTNTNVQRLQTMGELLQSRKRDYLTEWTRLNQEAVDTNKNQGPDWRTVDGGPGPSKQRMDQLGGLLGEINGQMADVDKQIQAQGMKPDDNPMYHILREQTGTGFRIKTTAQLRALDPTGVLLASAHPIVPFVPGVGRPDLKPNQMFTQDQADTLYDQLALAEVISKPEIIAVYTDPNVWAQAAAANGYPVDGFENAKAIFQSMVWLHANPGATLPVAPPGTPPPNVTPKKGPVYTRGGTK